MREYKSKNNYQSEYAKRKRENETPEQREKRLIRQREYKSKRLENETPEQREKRLIRQRKYDRKKRENEKLKN